MSLVCGSMEVTAGPTVGFQGDSTGTAYVNKGQQQDQEVAIKGLSCIEAYLKKREGESAEGSSFCLGSPEPSAESSSIGVDEESSCASDDGSGEEEEVRRKLKGGLGSMGLLEDSLPIKRGLSNFFSGKSKSFASLTDVTSMKDLAKPENPFNKRRRTLVACKSAWSRRSFCNSLSLLSADPVQEEDNEEEDENKDSLSAPLPIQGRKFKTFKSPRSFSLTDLSNA